MTVQEWLGEDNKLGQDIWEKKYRYGDETFDEWLDRVSGKDENLRRAIIEKKFLLGGRILANRGLPDKGVKVTYSNCFVRGTMVYTDKGYKPIEEVVIGDRVLTHNNRFMPVENTLRRSYSDDLCIIDGYNFDRIICTSNHKFLTDAGWVEAADLTKNNYIKYMKLGYDFKPIEADIFDYITISDEQVVDYDAREDMVRLGTEAVAGNGALCLRYGNFIKNKFEITDDLVYVIGRWLGDGSITKRKDKEHYSIFQIVFSDKERDDLERCKSIIDDTFGISCKVYSNEQQHTLILRTDNVFLCEFFHKICGERCETKNIFDEAILPNINWVIGLLDADGLVTDNGVIRLSLKNKELLKSVKTCLSLNNIVSGSIKKVKNNSDFFIYKLEIPKYCSIKLLPLMSKSYDDDRMSICECNEYLFTDIDGDLYLRIKNITIVNTRDICDEIEVYNLSVAEDNSYIVDGVVAHNCYVIEPPGDSIEDIFDCAKKLARTYSFGGGCGVDVSNLAPRGAKVSNTAKFTSGAVSFMDLYSLVTGLIGQSGRRGALMISLSCEHPDLEEFIGVKQNTERVTKANISIRMTDRFMAAVKNREPFELSFTRTETGETITKTVDAYTIFHKICESNWDWAEPGMLFWDRIENWNLLSCDDSFHYAGTNPCAEEPLPPGGSCLLGSINLSEFVREDKTFDFEGFAKIVDVGILALNDVLEEGLPLHPLKEQRESVSDWKQVGLGILGLADMLIKMGIRYGSDEAIHLCDMIGQKMAYQAIKTSAYIAKIFGHYPKYHPEAVMQSAFFSEHVGDTDVSCGLANSQLLTIAPTGTLSTMIGVSGGIEPIFANYYTRKTESLHGHDEYYKVYTPIVKKYMDEHGIADDADLPDFFVTAQSLDYTERIKMQAIWQKHIDASISSTVNVPNSFTVEQTEDLYMKAWEAGLKGVTIFRDGCKRVGILTTDKEDKQPEEDKQPTNNAKEYRLDSLPRGVVIKADEDRKSTRLNSSHNVASRMPSSA